MTIIERPVFLDSEYAYKENGEWTCDDDAPEKIKKEIDEYNKVKEMNNIALSH